MTHATEGSCARWLLETVGLTTAAGEQAVAAARCRFPEVEVDRRFAVQDGADSVEVWLCRAPSESHVIGWAVAAALRWTSLRRVDAERS